MEVLSGKQNFTEAVQLQSCKEGAVYIGEGWVRGTAGGPKAAGSLYPLSHPNHEGIGGGTTDDSCSSRGAQTLTEGEQRGRNIPSPHLPPQVPPIGRTQ